MDETAIDLLSKMVILEPSKRISAKEALNHPYFAEFRNGGFVQPIAENYWESLWYMTTIYCLEFILKGTSYESNTFILAIPRSE